MITKRDQPSLGHLDLGKTWRRVFILFRENYEKYVTWGTYIKRSVDLKEHSGLCWALTEEKYSLR